MAGHGVDDDPNLKGFTRYFNSETNRGRANVSFGNHINWHRMMFADVRQFIHSFIFRSLDLQWAKATYAVIGLIIAYNVLKPKKTPAKQ